MFSLWKVAGTPGGSTSTFLDSTLTIYNEDELTAERLGRHLPGFDDSMRAVGSPSEGFSGSEFKFYRITITLRVPDRYNISLSFNFSFN
jgi:hypothetical protein